MVSAPVDAVDLAHLQTCLDLAREALEDGDEPFGSILVDADGEVRFADRNRVRVGPADATQHPELAAARWAAVHLGVGERAAATVYTSNEHCPMCAAAHGWVGLGRVVYAVSSAQLSGWLADWGAPPAPVAALPISSVAPDVPASGPAPALVDEVRALHRARFEADFVQETGV